MDSKPLKLRLSKRTTVRDLFKAFDAERVTVSAVDAAREVTGTHARIEEGAGGAAVSISIRCEDTGLLVSFFQQDDRSWASRATSDAGTRSHDARARIAQREAEIKALEEQVTAAKCAILDASVDLGPELTCPECGSTDLDQFRLHEGAAEHRIHRRGDGACGDPDNQSGFHIEADTGQEADDVAILRCHGKHPAPYSLPVVPLPADFWERADWV